MSDSNKKTILSCIQPTGYMHYGNYFGAVQNWVNLQEKYNCIYGVVDYHAMTMPYDIKKLRNNSWELIYNLLAVGVKAENLFIQSLVPEHAELSWIFNCFCSYGHLSRMTQFKDKGKDVEEKGKDAFITAGLFSYPVLQAADILIYKADFVPVGKDQDQHLELSRAIGARFNHIVGKEYFTMPETLHSDTPKIKSTADPTKKMSKSAGEKHYINVFSDEARIRKQVRSAVTDQGDAGDTMSEGIENLFTLLKACEKMDDHDSLMNDYNNGSLKYVTLKDAVADALVEKSASFTEKRNEITADKRAIKYQIKQSSMVIRERAQQTLKEVKELTGLMNV